MDNLLQHGIAVFKSGNKEEARKLFISFIKKNSQSERGWEWMYNVSLNNKERIYCLKQILHINPGNKKAKQLLHQILDLPSPTQANLHNSGPRKKIPHTQKNGISIIAVGAVAVFFMLVFGVMLAVVSPRLAWHNNNAGYNCLFLSLNGKRLCYSSPVVAQIVDNAAFPVTTAHPTKMLVYSATPTIAFAPTVTVMPAITLTPITTFIPTDSRTSTPDALLTAHDWRKWPIVPEFSPHAEEILREAVQNLNLDSHTFSKVGDCHMTAGTFLAGYANGKYSMPDGTYETVQWFSKSMIADNMTAVNGYGINTVFDPAFGLSAGYNQCSSNETPLDCELRTRRPIIVLVGMGTNWIPNAEVSFEKYLRQVVDNVLETGALPILATKADNVEGDWKLNQVIAQVAYDYDLPLVNVWRSVQDLPNHGLEKAPRQVYLTGDGWMKRNYAWLVTLDNARKIIMQ